MTLTERIDAYTLVSTRQRRAQMWLVFTVLWVWALGAVAMCVQPLFTPNPEAAAISFAGAVFLGMLVPGLALLTSAVAGRGPGILLWVAFAVGGLIIAAAPLLIFAAGGSWDSEVIVLARRGRGAVPNPMWSSVRITFGLAAVMAIPGILGVVRCLRRNGRQNWETSEADRG